MATVITAHDLAQGHAVFLSPEGWHPAIARAMVAFTAEEAEQLEAMAARMEAENRIVGAYLVEVSTGEGAPQPVTRRERIRAGGLPTIPVGYAAAPASRVAA